MANALAAQIRALTTEKIDFVDDSAEANVDGIVTSALSLDDAADAFVAPAGDDTDQAEIAGALVDLFDDVNLSPSQTDKLNGVVNGLLKSGSAEQKTAAKDLFAATLAFGIAAKAQNTFFDDLLAAPPPVEP